MLVTYIMNPSKGLFIKFMKLIVGGGLDPPHPHDTKDTLGPHTPQHLANEFPNHGSFFFKFKASLQVKPQ